MVFGALPNALRPTPGSLLDRWLQRTTPQPDTFVCGIRGPGGDGAGGSGRWRYRRVWVDPLRENGIVTVWFNGKDSLRVRFDVDLRWTGDGPRPRPGLDVLPARSADSGTEIMLAVPPGEFVRFGIDVS